MSGRTTCLVLAAAFAALALGCGGTDDPTNAPDPDEPDGEASHLEVSVWPQGRPGESRDATVTCADPSAGGEECAAIERVDAEELAPTPPDVACTQIFGGPQEATIEGTLRGEELDIQLSRRNGCEISRWEAAQPLLRLASPRTAG